MHNGPSASRRKGLFALSLLLIAFIAGAFWSLSTGGRSDVGFTQILRPEGVALTVLTEIRAPRSIAAGLIGACLALAGLTLQAITRNALAAPSILGVSQGAALGLALVLIFPTSIPLAPEGAAALGAFGAGCLSFAIAGGFTGRIDATRLILGGIAVGALAFAMVRFAFTLEDELARSVTRWTIGDIADMRWPAVIRLSVAAVLGALACLALSHRFNLMALGQETAQGLGADPKVTLLIGMALAAILTGVSVSVAGPVAFVGLAVPHLVRALFGQDYRRLVPMTMVAGAALLMIADGASKSFAAPLEIPVGVVVALIGAPWFLWQTIVAKDLL